MKVNVIHILLSFLHITSSFLLPIKSLSRKTLLNLKNNKQSSPSSFNNPKSIKDSNNDPLQDQQFNTNIWTIRRKLVRTCLMKEAEHRYKQLQENTDDKTKQDEKNNNKTKITLLITTFFLAISATILRFGGRAAFVQLLGLDFISNSDLKLQVDSFLTSFESLGDFRFIAFLGAWIIAKTLCIDAATLILALTSGVLFGGIAQGTAVSVTCSSLASLVCTIT